MWRHHPQTAWLMRRLDEGEIGDLVRIQAEFSFMLDRPDDYRWRDDAGGGSLWDIGAYCVNAARLFYGDEPETVAARLVHAPGASIADASAVGWLDFGRGRLAAFHSSFVSTFSQSLALVGTRGRIDVERPFIGRVDQPTRCRILTAAGERWQTFEPDNAYTHMVQHFRRTVHDTSFALLPAEDGVAQAHVMEALSISGRRLGMPQTVSDD